MLHVYPINDLHPHDTESTSCPCNPTLLIKDPLTGEHYNDMLLIHNSFDRREAVEAAEAILNAPQRPTNP